MEIRIFGRVDNDTLKIDYLTNEHVFVDYLDEDVFLGDVFKCGAHTIRLKEIQLQWPGDEGQKYEMMAKGWKYIGLFEWLDVTQLPALRGWLTQYMDMNWTLICEKIGRDNIK
jgi:hypothetical protein